MYRRAILRACALLRFFGFLLGTRPVLIVQQQTGAQIEANNLLNRFVVENIWV
jgi:hypothetical protein